MEEETLEDIVQSKHIPAFTYTRDFDRPMCVKEYFLQMSKNPTRALENEEWFHEDLAREGAESLLVNEGDYLVRQRTHNEERQIVLSVRWNGHKHFIFKQTPEVERGLFFFSMEKLMKS